MKRSIFIACMCMTILLSGCGISSNETDSSNRQDAENEFQVSNIVDSSFEVVSDNENDASSNGTDWSTYEPAYIGSLPVGCVLVPDATPDNVSACLQSKLQTTESFEAASAESTYIKSKMIVENLLEVQGCTGTAILNFDWNDTLSSIVFKFEDGGNFTTDLFNQLHSEISAFLGTDTCWSEQYGLHKDAQSGNYFSCSWRDGLACEVSLSCYFDDVGKPDGGMLQFERTVSVESANHSIPTIGRNDAITQNGLKITGTYHAGSNPYVEGTATNNSETAVEFVRVKISLYDKNDKVIDTAWTYAVGAEGLEPGETTKWMVYCSDAEAITISIMD
ncbi:FxLYD domain-containing protein [Flavonifractor sp. An10]|uniref:FxLYD domain-containing protein n=1 Tax=Flavonifractor sp. An10 TaxID=1965537 RepID=UPI00114106A3|nr:FxLYD domain-containing protein [Flavonifractor sp. An10]